MASHAKVALFSFFTLLPLVSNAQQSLTSCPANQTIVQDSLGNSFAICPQTDYDWASTSWIGNVKNDLDCAGYCTSIQGCTYAVYDRIYGWCHAKANVNGGLWDQNTQYDAISPYTGPISACPTEETVVTDGQGRMWAICPFSDYQGPTITYNANIQNTQDCFKLCSSTPGCVNGLFDRINKGCHVKATSGLTWATSKQFDSLRLVSSASSSSTTSSSTASSSPSASSINGFTCNTKQSVLTTTDGSTFALCTGTDWQGTSTYVLNNYLSSQACAEACSLTPICTNAIWDTQNNVCHIKGAQAGLTQATNTQFNQIRLIKKAAPVSQSPAIGGKWSGAISFPVVPAAVYVVPRQPYASKIMAFSANADESFGTRTGLTQFASYDYTSGSISHRTVSNTGHDMFCPGISTLQDGRVVVQGGSDASIVSIYNASTDSWTRAANMNLGRGYQSSTTLSNGKIFTIGGSFSGGIQTKNGEIYDSTTDAWTLLNGCSADALNTQDTTWRRDNHAWLYGWSNGSVFQAGPSRAMNWYGTANGGSTTSAGTRNATYDAMCGVNVMYDTGKILAAGGTPLYDDSTAVTTTYLITISSVGQQAQVQKASDMKYTRAFANNVVLPDGSVVVLGGQKHSRQFTDIEYAPYPELYSPKTNTWTVMNAEAKPRNYHSSAVLLGDGTIFSGGGGLCYTTTSSDDSWACDPSAQHMDAEIFSPPYLFNADGSAATRPVINGLTTTNDNAGNWVRVGGTLTVTMKDYGALTFSVVRMGSSTHSVNTDQRRLSLPSAVQNGSKWTIKLPTDSGILLPGYWFLFAMNKNGTPSIARVIQVRL